MSSGVSLYFLAVQVFESTFVEAGIREEVALKVIDVPTSVHDPCYQVLWHSIILCLLCSLQCKTSYLSSAQADSC